MKNKRGQILLITVMLLATVMTIVLSISFKSVTETQVTKLEEESQKALAAAESAIEVALKENQDITYGPGITNSLTAITGFSGAAIIDTATSETFATPSIPRNGSYTFYLGNYDADLKTIGASSAQNITLCFQSGAPNPAIEVTLIKKNPVTLVTTVKKYVIDQDSRITNASTTSPCTPDSTNYSFSKTIQATDIETDGQFLLVRVLYAPTRLLFNGDGGLNLPIQGRTVSSTATSSTSTGVSKKVTLFQTYPQIPGEFFTTAF